MARHRTASRAAARRLAAALLALPVLAAGIARADLTDLATQPLANMGGTVAVKPNVMFILDDSGSMQWDYLPDQVGDADTGLTPDYTAVFGDPPYTSANFNRQYYNPEITYLPPVGYDGGTTQGSLDLQPQNAARTTNWTSVRTDGFNKQNKDQLGNTTNYVNLASNYPDRVYCTASGDNPNDTAKCKTNSAGFIYAHGYSSLTTDPYTVGLDAFNKTKYRYGAPYYFNILPGEYCSDEALTTCQPVSPGSGAPPGFPYPARVRWCTSAAEANAATPSAGACQGRWLGSYTHPRFGGSATATVAKGSITIGNSGSDDSVSITNIRINGVSVINTTLTASGGTNSSGERSALATAVANAINSYNSSPDYRACAGTGCNSAPYSTYGLGSVSGDQVIIIPVTAVGGTTPVTDNSRAGFAIEVTAPAVNTAFASGTLAITNSGTGSGKITSITVGPAGGPFVEVLNNSLANFGSNSSSNRQSAAEAVRQRINSYANGSPWEYTARRNTACGGQSASSTRVCIDAPLSAGALPNGFVINVTAIGGVTTTVTPFAGGQSRQIPTTTTSITAGSGVVTAFQRVDIVSSRTTYPKAADRSDCVTTAGVCTYDEEMTNFANWYAYYRTRNQAMKSAAGRAFLPLDIKYRLGFNTINNTSFNNTGGTRWLPIGDLSNAHKSTWYDKLYAAGGTSTTPLRGALDRMGQYFSGTLSGADSPIQYSCQQNFSILTTDGYWNETYSGSIGNVDNIDDAAQYCTRSNGCYDGNVSGASSTLADVALHYYKNDLRPDLENNVPVMSKDPNPAQHMTTFTLGLGVDGVMSYRKDYETATTGDFYRIKTGDSDCSWAPGATCNWPRPLNLDPTAVDDLWHAAVNGHGKYFSAQDPASLASGLSEALQGLKIREGAASASSTSTPNITQEDRFEFSATFRTYKWDGELVKKEIDLTTGRTLDTVLWSAQEKLDEMVGDSNDSRTIYTTQAASPAIREFRWLDGDSLPVLTAEEQAWFNDRCAGTGLLSQCSVLGSDDKAIANNGTNLVNWLRGQQAMQSYFNGTSTIEIFRARDHVLGDIAGSKPAYVAKPKRSYTDPGYSAFIAANTSREATVYAGGNDGMLHALSAANGTERWAYVPRMVMPELYRLADVAYGSSHRYYVDGSPTVADAKIGGSWKTILVGGLNGGGRGYYALDITNPDDPKALWEICHSATLCPYRNDADLGYSYGEPIVAKRPSDGKWVVLVTSGYNNVSPGDGRGYLYVLDAANGAILDKISTGTGNTTTPSGLARIADYVEEPDTDNTALLVYGGDMLGNLWRFDLATNSVIRLAQLADGSGQAQPITARPETGKCGDRKMVYVGTGAYLGPSDADPALAKNQQVQTLWGIRDNSTTLGAIRGNSMVEQTLSSGAGGYTITNNSVDLETKNGWFVDLDLNTGERANLDPQLANGVLVFITNQPSSTGSAACETGGKSFWYQFAFCRGSAPDQRTTTKMGGQYASAIAVGFILFGTPTGAYIKAQLADPKNPPDPVPLQQGSGSGTSVRRVSWRELAE